MWQIYAVIYILYTMSNDVRASLINRLQYFDSQNYYDTSPMLQIPFSMDNVIGRSLELALHSCQENSMWQKWNCPTADFLLRRASRSSRMDREDAYVQALTTAAILYTITKNCSSGIVADCGCNINCPSSQCSDNPQEAELLYNKNMDPNFSNDFFGSLRKHNHLAIINLLRKSLVKQCGCRVMSPTGGCLQEVCKQVMKPFASIAQDIRAMYEESIQLEVGASANTKVLWDNIPLDVLIYSNDSPNYCEPEAVPQWHGIRFRICSKATGEHVSEEERNSCQNLCSSCGYRVRSRSAVIERPCNCHITWTFQVQCDMCATMERQYYCY